MKAQFNTARIESIAVAVPRQSVDLASLSELGDDKTLSSVINATGIHAVRIAPKDMTTSDLCAEAAQKLMTTLSFNPSDIDGIVFVSQTPDYITPATSAVLQHRLGLKREVANFDINQGCSGYVYGLLQAHLLIGSGMCKHVLVCAGDTSSRFVASRDRSTRLVFGDAGSATLVSAGEMPALFNVMTDGAGAQHIMVPAGGQRCPRTAQTAQEVEAEDGNFRSQEHLFMDGREVTAFAIREIPKIIEQTLTLAGWERESVGIFALHQANRFILDYIAKKTKVERSRMPFSCEAIGNASVASIPLMLVLEAGQLKAESRLQRAMLCGFGVGLSWGAVATSLEATAILPLTDL